MYATALSAAIVCIDMHLIICHNLLEH